MLIGSSFPNDLPICISFSRETICAVILYILTMQKYNFFFSFMIFGTFFFDRK